jgi:small subunit ribosomal protein S17
MANKTTNREAKQENAGIRRQTMTGTVVSNKMKDTAVVLILRYVKHPKYGKYVVRRTKVMAHDPGNTKKEGEKATVEACRPISKHKAFKVIA